MFFSLAIAVIRFSLFIIYHMRAFCNAFLRKKSPGGTLPVEAASAIRGLIYFLVPVNRQKFTYYAGAAWSKAGEIVTPEDWFKTVADFRKDQMIDIQF